MEAHELEKEINGICFEADKASELEYQIQTFTVSTGPLGLGATQVGLEDLASELEEVISSLESAAKELCEIAGRLEDEADEDDDDETE